MHCAPLSCTIIFPQPCSGSVHLTSRPPPLLPSPVQSKLQLSDEALLHLHRAFKRYVRQGTRAGQERQQLQQQLGELLQVVLGTGTDQVGCV